MTSQCARNPPGPTLSVGFFWKDRMPETLETVRGVYAAFAKADIPGVLAASSADIRWTEAERGRYGGVSIGPNAVLQDVFMKLGTEWDGFSAVPHGLVPDGDVVVVLGEYCGTFTATGKSFKAPLAHAWKLQDGKARPFQQYTDAAVHLRPMLA